MKPLSGFAIIGMDKAGLVSLTAAGTRIRSGCSIADAETAVMPFQLICGFICTGHAIWEDQGQNEINPFGRIS